MDLPHSFLFFYNLDLARIRPGVRRRGSNPWSRGRPERRGPSGRSALPRTGRGSWPFALSPSPHPCFSGGSRRRRPCLSPQGCGWSPCLYDPPQRERPAQGRAPFFALVEPLGPNGSAGNFVDTHCKLPLREPFDKRVPGTHYHQKKPPGVTANDGDDKKRHYRS